MAQIIYEGVASGGDLFKGMKFYVVQRVPSRNHWLALIESNGGEVTKTDKNITYVIADHMRKDAPEGSVSWAWIEKSVKNGRLENIEGHRAGPQKRAVREVASGQPIRAGRVPFTAEDDSFLMSWGLKAERKGLSLRGNDIYKQLEKVNNRHTWQSWRDRWIKHVSLLPRQLEVSDDDDGPVPPPTRYDRHRSSQSPPASRKLPEKALPRSRAAEKSNPARKARSPSEIDSDDGRETSYSSKMTSSRRSAPEPVSKAPQSLSIAPTAGKPKFRTLKSVSPPNSPGSTEANPFTNKEKNRCLKEYDHIMNLDEREEIDAWNTWARLYPKHTAQEWRNFFEDHIIPLKEAEKLAVGEGEVQKEKKGERGLLQHPKAPRIPASPGLASPSLGPIDVMEIEGSQGASGETPDSEDHPRSIDDLTVPNEEVFKQISKVSLEEDEVYNHTINGRDFSLYQLWQVVCRYNGYKHVTNSKSWNKVAADLKFDISQHRTAPVDLRECYEKKLLDLELHLREASYQTLQDISPSKTQRPELLKSPEIQYNPEDGPDTEDYNDDLDYAPSTANQRPDLISNKRRSDDSSSDNRHPHNKKRRTENGRNELKKVPSTPEDIINGTRTTRHPETPSPLKHKADIERYSDQVEDEEEDDFDRTAVEPISSVLPRKMQRFEPETQDFQFTQPGEVDKSSLVTTSPERSKAVQMNTSSSEAIEEGSDSDDSSTDSLTESQKAIELENFVDRWVSLGYNFDLVIEALQATCGLQEKGPHEMFEVVIEDLTEGRGIPENIRGVWTPLDDEILEAGSKDRRYSRLVVKHGSSGVIGRNKFLADAKESEL
ncbi:hypothetical protein HYALB_00000179 [Hymenoscyphus albidus]|uniref:DNA-binding protein RAP1 n=1 Tax=Hymenoscyphus albidus TaxID=595503 RepID=A0A9N9LDN5_9HELO|nr:hypothetical protein HYALB_00000179 [Hymenoscyphus albidus]